MLKHAVLAATFSIGLTALPAAAADWTKVAEALGKPGTEMAGGVYRVGMPRTDLHVTLDGVEIKPTLALGSWLAFRGEGDMAMVMGDLVLTDAEVNPVMKQLEDAGLEITALHNHLLRASPATFYMHVRGHGDPAKMAAALHTALALSGTPLVATPAAASPPPALDLDTAMIDRVLGVAARFARNCTLSGLETQPREENARIRLG